jgi:hypothetical protein
MTTMLTEPALAPDAAPAPSRRRTRSRPSDGTSGRRSRQPKLAGDALVASLADMVDQLIKENRELKRALARAESGGGASALGQSAKILAGLQRRVYRSLTADASPRQRRAGVSEAAASPRPRRKVTDPEVLERRRQALAKARAARAAKRQAVAGEQAN